MLVAVLVLVYYIYTTLNLFSDDPFLRSTNKHLQLRVLAKLGLLGVTNEIGPSELNLDPKIFGKNQTLLYRRSILLVKIRPIIIRSIILLNLSKKVKVFDLKDD